MKKETKEQRRKRWNDFLDVTQFPDEFSGIIKDSLRDYSGDISIFESAVGALFLGICVGWRPLFIIHNQKTIKRYESILNVKFRDYMEPTTDLSDKSQGYNVVETLGDFWAGVRGSVPVEGRNVIGGIDSLQDSPVS
jgi:hypothetical protein